MLGLDLSSRGVESHSGSIRPPRRWHAHAIPSWTRRIGRPVCGLTWWAGCDSGLRHVRSAYTHTLILHCTSHRLISPRLLHQASHQFSQHPTEAHHALPHTSSPQWISALLTFLTPTSPSFMVPSGACSARVRDRSPRWLLTSEPQVRNSSYATPLQKLRMAYAYIAASVLSSVNLRVLYTRLYTPSCGYMFGWCAAAFRQRYRPAHRRSASWVQRRGIYPIARTPSAPSLRSPTTSQQQRPCLPFRQRRYFEDYGNRS